jgi:hypothetical protein
MLQAREQRQEQHQQQQQEALQGLRSDSSRRLRWMLLGHN